MTFPLFVFPENAKFGRVVPKSKIYAHSNPSKRLRKLFVDQVEQIVWQYKLAPETINIPARPPVTEIQVFDVELRTQEVSEDVLRCIDRSIPYPIFYRVSFGDKIKSIAAYKRPSDADSTKWVVDLYFETPWQSNRVGDEAEEKRLPLPIALDIPSLYQQMLQLHIERPPRTGESFTDLIERIRVLRQKKSEVTKLEARIGKEKQFNRKADLNSQLQSLQRELESLES